MPKTFLEGDTRINPETNIEEVYTPEGTFIPVTERPEAVNKNPVSTLSTDDGEDILDQTKKKFETQYGDAEINPSQDPNFVKDPTKNYDVFGNVVGDKPEDEVTTDEDKEGGYSFEEAQEIWGNDFTGIKREADGLFYPDSSAYERAGIKGMGEDLQEDVDETDQLIEDEYDKWQGYVVEEDPTFISQQRAITSQYDILRRQMESKNKARQRAIETMGYRHGTRQYAGAIQLGIEGEEIRQAGQRLTDITTEELSAKSAARVAFENNEYTKFSQKVDALQVIRKNKSDALSNYNDALIAANEAMTEQIKEEREAAKDERERQDSVTENLANIALASLTGDTDVDMEFLKGLADEYGIDVNMLSSQVAKLQTDMEKDLMTTDIKEYRMAVSQGYEGTFKEWQIEQKGEDLVSGAAGSKFRLNTKTGKYEMVVAPMWKETIGGGGEDIVEKEPLSINQVEQFRRSYGWTPPLGYTQSQLIQYMNDNPGATPEELEAGAKQADGGVITLTETEQFLNEEYFRNTYSKDELKSLSDKLGTSKFYTPASMDINRFIKEVTIKIEEARQQGYSDNEILEFLGL